MGGRAMLPGMLFASRTPAVAGRFYPGHPAELQRAVRGHLGPPVAAAPALGALLPHAGYVYSGDIAGRTLATIELTPTVIVIGPNHTRAGGPRAIWPRGAWQLPGGPVTVDAALASDLVASGLLTPDANAHLREHSIEVELPLLRARRPDIAIVPICLRPLSLPDCMALGTALAEAVRASRARGRDAMLVASSDLSHYVTVAEASRLDRRALAAIAALDPTTLYRTVVDEDISMCGHVPTTAVLAAFLALGGATATLVAYGHSGQVTGDDRVVGYAGVVFR